MNAKKKSHPTGLSIFNITILPFPIQAHLPMDHSDHISQIYMLRYKKIPGAFFFQWIRNEYFLNVGCKFLYEYKIIQREELQIINQPWIYINLHMLSSQRG